MNMNAWVLGAIIGVSVFPYTAAAGDVNGTAAEVAQRVGVYDSRAVAFAHFWSADQRRLLNERMAAARKAKDSGDAAHAKELGAALAADQKRIHLAVFSTAPADEAMAALAARLPALQRELGVARFISKWDTAALRDVPDARRLDVTDRLVSEFKPDERRLKTIEQMKTKLPLPLDEAKRLDAAGQL